ncbi:YkoF family thiamine/hydroxymethylpyrimidine-binding protein [Tepidibacillus fermentans]|uniref:YKOF-related protein n=1 Tax=Tepidibacillus fermentans TaxID=1281767 RepID=A0A4R3K9U3_9BACI|nr:YkoF family thiamine/hydroxymethylpyrimidine-binding protein [Tepidibacillus fermentans]TCS79411.1 YKOF-related protein [Tepidibacillus fermentans]
MISCQLALYPLATKQFESVITKALQAIKPLESQGLTIEVGSMSTVIKGNDDLVWEAVRTLFEESIKEGHQIVLNATLSNECGCDL